MIRGALIFMCGIAAGALLYETALERATVKPPRSLMKQPYAEPARLAHPIMKPDATMRSCTTSYNCGPERRYYAGMVRK